MDSNKIKTYLLDFQEKKFLNIKKRNSLLPETDKIKTVIGARRVGKTYLLFDKILGLEKANISRQQIIYLNFENPLFYDLSYKEIKEIIDIHWSLFPKSINKKLYLFIDEPQVIDKWEVGVRSIYDNLNVSIFLTGSSSKLLSKEISTSLRGRSLSTSLLSLSFLEFLQFKEVDFDISSSSSSTIAKIKNLLSEYLQYGGYPEIVLENNPEIKLKISKDYFDLTVYKDIIERHNIKNTSLIKSLISLTVSSCAKEFSLNKHYLDLKSRGLKLGKTTLYEYFDTLEDSFFVFSLKRFYHSQKSETLSIPKIYLGDINFLNLFSLKNMRQRFENIVFLELLRRTANNPLQKINYWQSDKKQEVDFLLSNGKKIESAIQVCYDINNSDTKKREITSLLECLTQNKIKSGYIINNDEDKEEFFDNKKIIFIPLWKWLLKK